jgi:hypothetical protein
MMKACISQTRRILISNKKKIYTAVVLALLLSAISAGVYAMFRVNGVVTVVDNNNVTVANFFTTQTVDLTGSPVNINNIKIGDHIKIQKNLQGRVLYVKSYAMRNHDHERDQRNH